MTGHLPGHDKGGVMIMRFDDGITVDTCGTLRTMELADGLYVLGHGFLIPVESWEEADETIRELTRGKET